MSDLLMFENKESYEKDTEQSIVGGASVSSMLKKNKNILDVESQLFTRFTNIVVPIGLHLDPIVVHDDNNEDNEDNEDNEYDTMEGHLIDTKKFDNLFYSVGKDLGISKERTFKNRTTKNPTK